MNRMKGVMFFIMTVALGAVIAPAATASGVPYGVGDVLAGDSNGLVKHFSPSGTLLDTLDTQGGAHEDTGMCFGENGNLRATNFSTDNMTLFDNAGNVLTFPWGGPFDTSPESCVVDASGDVYVGEADGSRDVLKFSPGGTLEATYDVATGPRGSDWIDLASDHCTLYYTSEGPDIRRFDVCTNTQLPDFATGFTDPGASTVCYALRIRPNAEVIVACTDTVYRLSATGTVLQRYPRPPGETSFLFALNLDPDNSSFWTAGFDSGNVYHVDIDTGAIISQFAAGSAVKGLAIFGEITVARPPANLTLEPATATDPVGTQHCVTAMVTDAGANPVAGVAVVFSVTGTAGNSATGTVTTDASGQAQFCYQGPPATGDDTITAYADTNGNGIRDLNEPSDTATKHWIQPVPVLDHFKCYSARQVEHRFHATRVVVVDQFESKPLRLVRPETFCTPAGKNGSGIAHPKAHLTCYTVGEETEADKLNRRVVATDQFGRHRLRLSDTDALCLPSSKSVTRHDPGPPPRGLDHFKCYEAHQFGNRFHPRQVVVTDQFGVERIRVVRPVTFCTPASKNGSPILHPKSHLTCYQVGHREDEDRRDASESRRRVTTRDQFGKHALLLGKTRTLCLPSTKHLL